MNSKKSISLFSLVIIAFMAIAAAPAKAISAVEISCDKELSDELISSVARSTGDWEFFEVSALQLNNAVRRPVDSDVAAEDVKSFSMVVECLRRIDEIYNSSADQYSAAGWIGLSAVHGYYESDRAVADLAKESNGRFLKHGCNHDSGSEDGRPGLFLLWHRAYLRALEITSRSILKLGNYQFASQFGIPYWNWQKNGYIPRAFKFSDEITLSQVPKNSSCYCDFSTVEKSSGLAVSKRSCNFNFGQTSALRHEVDDIPSVMAGAKLFTFNKELLSRWHDNVHRSVGACEKGYMGVPQRAAMDPIFWSHHSYIDYLFTQWLEKNKYGVNQESVEEVKNLSAAWNDKAYKFPVYFDGKWGWYSPTFEELNVAADASDSTVLYIDDSYGTNDAAHWVSPRNFSPIISTLDKIDVSMQMSCKPSHLSLYSDNIDPIEVRQNGAQIFIAINRRDATKLFSILGSPTLANYQITTNVQAAQLTGLDSYPMQFQVRLVPVDSKNDTISIGSVKYLGTIPLFTSKEGDASSPGKNSVNVNWSVDVTEYFSGRLKQLRAVSYATKIWKNFRLGESDYVLRIAVAPNRSESFSLNRLSTRISISRIALEVRTNGRFSCGE